MDNCRGAAGEIHPACHPLTEDAHRQCDCGCEEKTESKCLGGLEFEADTCKSIDVRSSTSWCVDNCRGAGGEIHPACHPDTEDAHKHCECGCEEVEEPALCETEESLAEKHAQTWNFSTYIKMHNKSGMKIIIYWRSYAHFSKSEWKYYTLTDGRSYR
jgi:hypothetical protein